MQPCLTCLSDEELKKLHANALDIIENVGIEYESRRYLELLEAEGQKADFESGIAWLKPDLVERRIKSAPRAITLGARNPTLVV